MHASVKTDSGSEEKKKVASCCENKILKALGQNADKFETASGTELTVLLTVHRELRETLKFLQGYNAKICSAKPGNSITITLQFFSANDLKAFLKDLSKLEDCLMKDLKQLPDCQKYDFKDIYIEVKVDEELCEEVVSNLRASKLT